MSNLRELLQELIDTQKHIHFVWGNPVLVEDAVQEQENKIQEILDFVKNLKESK
jgi:hypothetical protein